MSEFAKNIIKTILGVIVLTAIGNGAWEWVFRDLLISLGDGTLSIISSVFKNYVNSLYEDVGSGPYINVIGLPSTFVFIFITYAPVFLLMYVSQKRKESSKRIEGMKAKLIHSHSALSGELPNEETPSELTMEQELEILAEKIEETEQASTRLFRKLMVTTTVFAAVSIIFFSLEFFKYSFQSRASMFAERSIAIISPNITDMEEKILISKYRSVDDAASFYDLYFSICDRASIAGVKLPVFNPIGIPQKMRSCGK